MKDNPTRPDLDWNGLEQLTKSSVFLKDFFGMVAVGGGAKRSGILFVSLRSRFNITTRTPPWTQDSATSITQNRKDERVEFEFHHNLWARHWHEALSDARPPKEAKMGQPQIQSLDTKRVHV